MSDLYFLIRHSSNLRFWVYHGVFAIFKTLFIWIPWKLGGWRWSGWLLRFQRWFPDISWHLQTSWPLGELNLDDGLVNVLFGWWSWWKSCLIHVTLDVLSGLSGEYDMPISRVEDVQEFQWDRWNSGLDVGMVFSRDFMRRESWISVWFLATFPKLTDVAINIYTL